MRPVNLIPPEERRGDASPLRAGPLSYVLVAVLAIVLVAVTASVLTSNQIEDRRSGFASLERQGEEAAARAQALAPYTEFASLAADREVTVKSLAQSRFDWARVLNELALVMPSDVWLVSLTGTVSPEVQVDSQTSISSRAGVSGPALEITGCGTSQEAVAGFMTALRDIDGVTRVGLESSEKAELEAGSSSSGGETEQTGDSCQTRNFITQFQIVAAFDEVAASAAAPVPAAPAAPTVPEETQAETAQVAEGQQLEQEARDSSGAQTEKAENAVNVIPGVAR